MALAVAVLAVAGAATVQLALKDLGPGLELRGGDRVSVDLSQSRSLLRDQPLAAAPFHALGDAASMAGDEAVAARYYLTAARREPRDAEVRAKLVELYLADGDEAAAIHQLDALLRVSPEAGDPLLRRLLGTEGDATVRNELASRLALDPPWRALLPAALAATSDLAGAEELLSLLDARSPLRPPELTLRVSLLEQLGRPVDARRVWGEALPAELRPLDGLVFDGGFEHGEGPAPYGWRLVSPVGAAVGVDDSQARGGRSLVVLFEGRVVEFAGVSQDIVLEPGLYRLDLMAMTALDASARPFAWTIACRGTGVPIARLELPPASSGWMALAMVFEVLPSCPTQRLALVHEGRSLSERRLAGRMEFDAIRIQAAGR